LNLFAWISVLIRLHDLIDFFFSFYFFKNWNTNQYLGGGFGQHQSPLGQQQQQQQQPSQGQQQQQQAHNQQYHY
jgi:hypothetical protein